MLGGVFCVAHFITCPEKTQFNESVIFISLVFALLPMDHYSELIRPLRSLGGEIQRYTLPHLGISKLQSLQSRLQNPQKLIQLSPRSHPRHLVGKMAAQKDTIIDITRAAK